ncbi:MAG: DUF89 family protein [Anaerolineae bacterium]|nr:DUF89 family protein [Anaerolineae bacterium]
MRTYLDCYPCFLRQALEAARAVGADERTQHAVLVHVMAELTMMDLSNTPPEIGHQIHRLIRNKMNVDDPFAEIKAKSTREALALYPKLKELVAQAQDPLECAVRLAIAGNVIDLAQVDAPSDRQAMWASVEEIIQQPFAIGDLDLLKEKLAQTERVLYLSDNAGETVFDRVLIETMKVPTTYVVKGAPVLNDATAEDAIAAGIGLVADIIANGADAPGTILAHCSPKFRDTFEQAELIIAKGQANYETLSDYDRNIFFLLKVKCPVIAQDIGVPVGSIVCKGGGEHARV